MEIQGILGVWVRPRLRAGDAGDLGQPGIDRRGGCRRGDRRDATGASSSTNGIRTPSGSFRTLPGARDSRPRPESSFLNPYAVDLTKLSSHRLGIGEAAPVVANRFQADSVGVEAEQAAEVAIALGALVAPTAGHALPRSRPGRPSGPKTQLAQGRARGPIVLVLRGLVLGLGVDIGVPQPDELGRDRPDRCLRNPTP